MKKLLLLLLLLLLLFKENELIKALSLDKTQIFFNSYLFLRRSVSFFCFSDCFF